MARKVKSTWSADGITNSIPALSVLHIEDSIDDQVLLQTACGRANVPLDWHVVDSAAKAIAYLNGLLERSAREPIFWPDLVLLDLVMPCEDGLAVLKHIRATPGLQRLPVIILTGHQQPRFIDEGYRLGANSILHKPATFQQLVDLVRELHAFWTLAKRSEPGLLPLAGPD